MPKSFKLLLFGIFFVAPFFAQTCYSQPRGIFKSPPTSARVKPGKLIPVRTESFLRTELYFGLSKAGGIEITENEWGAFLNEIITPEFPAGLTIASGIGQFRDSTNKIIQEKSKILILLYPQRTRRASSQKIERIRRAYKMKFQQESVLRVDFPQPVRVSF